MKQETIAGYFALDGKVAIVTGAAQGLGKTVARMLGEAGARVVVADVAADLGAAAAAELRAEGLDAVDIGVDITDEASVQALFAALRERCGGCDILVNNAGAYPKWLLAETTADDWDRVQSLNLRGHFLCLREALRLMVAQQRGGRIINVSSTASLHPATFGNAAYSAAKGGANNLTRAAALEYARYGITVNAVAPGATDTGGDARQRAATGAPPVTGPAADRSRWILGRMGRPAEIGGAILYLAGPLGGYVTGAVISIDGGFLVS